MHDDGGQVVQRGARVGASRLVQVAQQVIGHVEAIQGELDVGVDLGSRIGTPTETLQMQTKNVRQSTDPKFLSRRLFSVATGTEKSLRIGQFLNVGELSQTICKIRFHFNVYKNQQ